MTEGHAAESKDCLGIPSSWQHDMRRWAHAGMRLLFPAGCAFCDGEGETPPDDVPICSACRTLFLEGQGLRCPRCGARLPSDLPPEPRCPHCLKSRLQFQSVLAMGVYRGELREAVLRMKQLPGEPLSMAVGRLLCRELGESLASLAPEVVVPVPMHWSRRLVRRTNSAEILAERVASTLRIPVCREVLVRRRNTPPQFGLSAHGRFRNVRRAFRLAAGYDLGAARVLLLDDILTTGATCSEAARVLLAAGAERVDVAVVARAEGI